MFSSANTEITAMYNCKFLQLIRASVYSRSTSVFLFTKKTKRLNYYKNKESDEKSNIYFISIIKSIIIEKSENFTNLSFTQEL